MHVRKWVILGLLCATNGLSAQTGSVEFAAGYGMGDLREIVYVDSKSWDLLSELIWPFPPSVRGSVEGTVRWDQAFLRVRLGSNAPLLAGIMIDRDWNLRDSATSIVYDQESQSPSYTLIQNTLRMEGGWQLGGWQLGGYEGPVNSVFAGVHIDQFYAESWSATNGSTVKATLRNGVTLATFTVNGLLITYRTLSVVPYLGWESIWRTAPLSPELSLRVSPWLLVSGQDFHVLRSIVFFDTAMGGLELQPSAALSWPVNDTLDAGLRGTLSWAVGVRGNGIMVRSWSSKESTPSSNTAGSGWLDWQLELFVRN